MTLRTWLRRAIWQADRTAAHGKYHDWRVAAAARAQAYRQVLYELERAGVDVLPRFPPRMVSMDIRKSRHAEDLAAIRAAEQDAEITPEIAAALDGERNRATVEPQALPTGYCTLTPPTLTDAERQAVEWCVEMAVLHATECDEEIATLRGLLERHVAERQR